MAGENRRAGDGGQKLSSGPKTDHCQERQKNGEKCGECQMIDKLPGERTVGRNGENSFWNANYYGLGKIVTI